MDLPNNVSVYGQKIYWEERYAEEDCYEWFADYKTIKHFILQSIDFEDKILMLGCGNSSLSADMYKDGYKNITNIDYSQVVIDNMESKYKHMVDMKWQVMDINDLQFEDGQFDVILEKGTLDALLTDEKSPWRLSDETEQTMYKITQQISNKLTPSGKFISITFSQPHFRIPLFGKAEFDWSINVHRFGDTFHYFYYVMNKGEVLSDADQLMTTKYFTEVDNKPLVYMEDYNDENYLFSINTFEDYNRT